MSSQNQFEFGFITPGSRTREILEKRRMKEQEEARRREEEAKKRQEEAKKRREDSARLAQAQRDEERKLRRKFARMRHKKQSYSSY